MKEYFCLNRQYDTSGKVVAYRLKDREGIVIVVKADVLKYSIAHGLIKVWNLSLTKDGRLINAARGKNGVENKPKAKTNITPKPIVTIWRDETSEYKDACSVAVILSTKTTSQQIQKIIDEVRANTPDCSYWYDNTVQKLPKDCQVVKTNKSNEVWY